MKRTQIVTRAVVALITIAAVGLFVWTLVRATIYAPDSLVAPASRALEVSLPVLTATSSLPSRLIVPLLGINANIQYVGENAQGNMRAPDNFTDVSWYEYGTIPGSIGTAVIAGHVDNGLGLDGVFKHLSDIVVGADVYIETTGGDTRHFKVSDVEVYPYQSCRDAFHTKWCGSPQSHYLRRSWVTGGDTYDQRIVIYADS